MAIIDISWRQPIRVQFQNGTSHLFRSAYDALDFLENEWPLRKGDDYRKAVRLCRVAVSRMSYTEAAREAFIASCREAALALTGGKGVSA